MSGRGEAVAEALASHPDGVTIDVWVVPGAARTEWVGMHDRVLRIRVAAPAEQGKANRAVAALLADLLGAGAVRLISGATARRKRFLVTGITVEEAYARLA